MAKCNQLTSLPLKGLKEPASTTQFGLLRSYNYERYLSVIEHRAAAYSGQLQSIDDKSIKILVDNRRFGRLIVAKNLID